MEDWKILHYFTAITGLAGVGLLLTAIFTDGSISSRHLPWIVVAAALLLFIGELASSGINPSRTDSKSAGITSHKKDRAT